jgi:DNA-binding MarR family transcriptional regulator
VTVIGSAIDRAQLAGRLRLVVTRLNRRLRQEGETGLGASSFSALSTIARRGPLSLGELASLEGLKPPSITTTVAGLEAQGLVTRVADPADRRVTRVTVTPRGRLRLLRSRTRKTAYLADRLSSLDERQLAVLTEAAAILEGALEEDR